MGTGTHLCLVSFLVAAAVTAGDIRVLTGVRSDTPWGQSILDGSSASEAERYSEAATKFEAALSAITAVSRDDRMDLAIALSGLGNCYAKMGRFTEAQPLHEWALALWRELSPDDIRVALELNNVADTFIARGDYETALRYQSEALKLDEAALGPMNTLVANDWNNLGVTYMFQRKYSAADKALRRAVEIGGALTPPHAKLTDFNGNLASLMLALHRPEEAEELQQRVLAAQVQERGRFHVSVGLTLVHIADCEIKLKKYVSAMGHAAQAIRILKERLGERHPRTGTAYFQLAIAYQGLRRSDLAERALEFVLAIDRQATVQPSARSAHLREYALVLRDRGKKGEAKAAQEMAAKVEQQDLEHAVSRETVDIKTLSVQQ